MDTSILIVGGSGLLGEKLFRLFSTNFEYDITCTYDKNRPKIKNVKFIHLDITDKNETDKLISRISPQVVIHTAAITNVDYCETHKEEAFKVNYEGTKNVADACRTNNSRLVYISTDYVFDGEKGLYVEEDAVNPINYYGKTKLEGEKAVQELCDDYLMIRTSVLYGWHSKPNFVTWVINELKQKHKVNVVKNQFNSPTLANNLADLILELIRRDESGIFHASGSERISRFEFAKRVANVFYLNKNLINPINSDDLDWIAKRPRDSSLDVSKISKIKKPLGIDNALKLMKGEI